MARQVSNSFVKQYEREAHLTYQREGSLLRDRVRYVGDVEGSTVTFQKIGTGSATTKDRHGLVTPMNPDHTPMTATLVDYYAGDYVDKKDLEKLNIDERDVIAKTGAYALGRKTDEIVITTLDGATNTTSVNLSAIDDSGGAALNSWVTRLFDRDVKYNDGQVTAVISWQLWGKMMEVPAFNSADYVDTSGMTYATGVRPKSWFGVLWIPHSGLTIASDERKNYIFHRTAVGLGSGGGIEADVDWIGDRAAWFIDNCMSMGAVLIDDNGVEELVVDESA